MIHHSKVYTTKMNAKQLYDKFNARQDIPKTRGGVYTDAYVRV